MTQPKNMRWPRRLWLVARRFPRPAGFPRQPWEIGTVCMDRDEARRIAKLYRDRDRCEVRIRSYAHGRR